jgi:riboflavin kinase/FMN adenylyltransferase|tara:strand:- start:1159 stop:2103 length:945 start_codon:yes stop_codon:yes gene_type:complete
LKIVSDNSRIKNSNYNIATIGFFDGIHVGHKKILEELVSQAKKNKGQSILVTFWPHPRTVLNKKNSVDLLLSKEDKYLFLEEYGVDIIYLVEFTKTFSKVTADAFIKDFLIDKLQVDKLIIGYNHNFGYKREGNYSYLKKNRDRYDFDIQEVKKEEIDKSLEISSSAIREKVKSGKFSHVNKMLGYKFYIEGIVEKGDGIGKTIDFPTANINSSVKSKILPGDGVYAAHVNIGKEKLSGMVNIGFRPTVKGEDRRIELHIFNFNRNIYGSTLRIIFDSKIREEIMFKNMKDLKEQLEKDKIESIKLLNNEKVRN